MKKLNKISYLILLVSICFSCGNKSKTTESKIEDDKAVEQEPNIVFILSDDQSWTDYGFMGDENIETPRLDKFASESLTFTRGYVPTPLCSPSLATIITGLYPKNHGILGNDYVYERVKGDNKESRTNRNEAYKPIITSFEKQTTLPDMLKEKGYLSFQTGKWWHGNYKIGGFDYGMTHGNPKRGGRHGDYGLEIGRKGMDTLTSYVDLAIKEKKPFFLWYAPFMPHRPHNPPQRLLDKYLKKTDSEHLAKYWAMCEWFDETCGELFDIIEEKGLTENTLFVYVCDNGWKQDPEKSGYMVDSKRAPYDMGIRTPIMYKWAGKITPKMDSKTITSSIDMVPTVLDILDIEKPDNLPGISVLDAKSLNERKGFFGEVYSHDFDTIENSMFYNMAIFPPYKIIVPDPVRKKGEVVQLFNIDEDPFEKHNIAENHPEVVEELIKKIKNFRSE
ncbi:sulfatase-like hydrolase/transferase [Winogradskyella litoriviva]|uniref:Sulfatase-like hydrolase/transferase n=1 Tax=Winogradskyella litoriviva TaxID=1220182 RepID=A0ABX2E5R2_9FLAO|nr:sulfatase-like hydrolase/transferase [Winogradskyella litoriviva]NRD23036.1 sulfatase-like hydrolase/transferase [Winogradskyella litoriviva]